jgi:hypothetical protein
MNIQVKVIKIIECDGGGDSGSGDVSGYVGTGADMSGSLPGLFNYNGFKKKRKKKHKKKKHESLVNEDTSATGGNDGALMGGEVYSTGVDYGTRPAPNTTGDLVLTPISTEPGKETGIYGIPKKKKNKEKEEQPKSVPSEKKLKILNWDSYIKAKMSKITYLN